MARTQAMRPERDSVDLLVFVVGSRSYALPAASVAEVVRCVAITELPGAPRAVEGVVNRRGTVVPVLDLRMRFGLSAQAPSVTDLLIFANSGMRIIAFRCDGEAKVRRAQADEIETGRDALTGSRFIAGVAKFPDGTVLIHDLAAFLTEAESAELEQALASESAAGVA